MRIPFISGEAPEGHFPINLYLQPEGWNGRPALMRTPGITLFSDFSAADTEVRGICVMGDYLYAVCGDTLYQVAENGTNESATTTLDTSSGHVFMATNGTQVMITDGTYGYYVTSSGSTPTLTKITDTDFPTPSSLAHIDSYFVVTKKDTGEFYLSSLNDASTWDALDYATAEGDPDELVACVNNHRELWLLGTDTSEIWYNSGDADFPFDRSVATHINVGCEAAASVALLDNSFYMFAHDRTVRRADGYNLVLASPPALNVKFKEYSTVSDAIGGGFQQGGNSFYVLTFPTEEKTWVLNVTTGLWHQWATGITQLRYRGNCFADFAAKTIVGDKSNGKLYYLDSTKYDDDGTTIKWTRTGPQIFSDNRNRLFFRDFEIEFKAGIGLSTGLATGPQAMLEWSDDGGRTWSNEHWTSIGAIGEYGVRSKWRRLGQARNRIFRVSGTDPVEIVIVGAYSRFSKGIS